MVNLSILAGELSKLFATMIGQVLSAIIAVIVVLVFLAIGYIVAKIVNWIVKYFLVNIKLEDEIKKRNLQNALLGFSITQIVTTILSVYILFAFLGGAADVININFFTNLIYSFLNYIPSLVQGLIVIAAILFIAAYIDNTINKGEIILSRQIGLGIKVFLAYVSLIIALPLILPGVGEKITVLERLLELFISALIIMVGLGGGLAIGLGVKDSIARAADKHQGMFDSLFSKLERRRSL